VKTENVTAEAALSDLARIKSGGRMPSVVIAAKSVFDGFSAKPGDCPRLLCEEM
jgi:hypothetical protein